MSKNIYVNGRKEASFDNRGSRGTYRIVPTWRMKLAAAKLWTIRKIKQALVIGAIAGTGALALGVFNITRSNTFEFHAETANATDIVDMTPIKIAKLKSAVVKDIKDCERAGYTENDAVVTFDPDKSGKKINQGSFGVLQFKVPTIIWYMKKLNNKDLTPKDAILLALDEDEATKLATQIMFEVDGSGDWVNCYRKYDVVKRIKFIKELETI